MTEIKRQLAQIVQLDNFSIWLKKQGRLSFQARCMWIQLLIELNRKFWPDQIELKNDDLMSSLGLSATEKNRQLFNQTRRELVRAGLLEFTPGKRNANPVYTLKYLIIIEGETLMMSRKEAEALELSLTETTSDPDLNETTNANTANTETEPDSNLNERVEKTAPIVGNGSGYGTENDKQTKTAPEIKPENTPEQHLNNNHNSDHNSTECTIRTRENKNKNKNKNIYNTQTVIRDTEQPGNTPGESPRMTDEDIPETVTEPETSTLTPNQPEESLRSVSELSDGVPVTGEDLQLGLPGIPAAEKKRRRERLDDDKCEELREFYNDHRGGMVKCRKMNRRRRSLLNARVREYDEDTVRSVMVAAGRNSFYGGSGPRGWRADIEWILKSSNFDKIYERDLDSGGGSTQDFLDLAARAYSQGGGFDTAGSSAADRTAADQLSGEFLEFSVE